MEEVADAQNDSQMRGRRHRCAEGGTDVQEGATNVRNGAIDVQVGATDARNDTLMRRTIVRCAEEVSRADGAQLF